MRIYNLRLIVCLTSLIIVSLTSCKDEFEAPDQLENRVINKFFRYDGSNQEIIDAISSLRTNYSNETIVDIYNHAGIPNWEAYFKNSNLRKSTKSQAANAQQDFQVEYQFPVLPEGGDRTEAILLYTLDNEGNKFWKAFSRKYYESFDFRTKLEFQPLLVAGQFLSFDHRLFGVNSIQYGDEYELVRADQNSYEEYEPCEPQEFGCNCDKIFVKSSNTGAVIDTYYTNCNMLSFTVTPDGDDVGDITTNPGNYVPYDYTPVYYDLGSNPNDNSNGNTSTSNGNGRAYSAFFNLIYTTQDGFNYVHDYSSDLETLLEDIHIDSHEAVDNYLRNGPSNPSRSEVSYYLTLMSNIYYEHDNTREFAYSLNELARASNVSDDDLYSLALNAQNSYNLLSDAVFDFDLLSYTDQIDVARDALLLDVFPEVQAQINENGWPLSSEEWDALWEIFKPMIAELFVESLPGGGLAIAFKDVVTGINNGDTFLVATAITATIVEFFPPGKVFKVVWRTGRRVRKGFKFVKYARAHLSSIGGALQTGLKADVDGTIVKISKNGDEVARISNNSISISKHSVPAKDGSVVFKKAEDVNNSYPPNYQNPYDVNSSVTEFLTSRNEQFVRVYKSGSNANPNGRWLVKKSDIEHLSPAEIKNKLALPDLPDMIIDVSIPNNTFIRTGKAGGNSFGLGGLIQFEIPFPNSVSTNWFTNPRGLN